MAGLSDDQVTQSGARLVSSAKAPTAGLTDDQVMQAGAIPASETQRGRAALNGLTFGLGPRVMATARSLGGEDWEAAKQDEYKKLDAYRKADPWGAIGWEVAGSLPTLAVPGVNAIGNANRVRQAIQTGGNVGHEVARGAAQIGALQSALHSKDYTHIGDVIENAAVGGATGYVGGRALNGIAQPLINTARNAAEAIQVGSGPRAAALRQLREAVGETGADLAEAGRSIFPVPLRGMAPEAQRAIITAHSQAIAGGADNAAALQAAARAYANRNPGVGPQTIHRHVAQTVADYAEHNRVPLLAAEVLSGSDQPIRGEMRSFTQGIMNSPGEGRTALSTAVQERQNDAIARTRELIDNSVGAGIPGGGRDYVGGMRAIEDATRQARNDAYALARSRARAFDIDPVLERWRGIAAENAGTPRAEIMTAAGEMQDWFARMTGRLADLNPAQRGVGDNQILLNSYRQARTALSDRIGQLSRAGDREAARLLTMMKGEMDDVVRRRNPTWWRANNGTAETYRITDAAERGRTLPLTEGAPSQELRADMATMTAPEREAARMGLARQMHDQVSRLGDNHDVAKLYLKGGGDQDTEGMRGLMTDVLGHARGDAADRARAAAVQRGVGARAQTDAARRAREAIPTAEDFYRDIGREQIARSTYGLDKGSQTSALQKADEKRNALLSAAMSMMHSLNIPETLSRLSRLMAERAGRNRDAELGRMLASSTNQPHALLGLIDELLRTAPTTRNPWSPVASEMAARVAPTVAGQYVADDIVARRQAQRR